MKLGCVGFGAMGSALVKGFISTGVNPQDVLVYDSSKNAQEKALSYNCMPVDSLNSLEQCDIILVAVKPQNLKSLAADWQLRNKIVISILAGIKKEQLKEALKIEKIVRVMPNMPAQIGKGVLAVNFSFNIEPQDKDFILKLLMGSGGVYEIEEKHFDAVTALSGSGPAFLLLAIEAMTFGSVAEGLPAGVALEMATKTMLGTAEYLLSVNEHPAKVRDLITSPQGTTAAGLQVLEEKGARAAYIGAIRAAANRGRELSKGE